MKIKTPYYYKDFKCIAGACTDTCCAGWDVDVDEASYKYYKGVKGAFGKRLKKVMVPDGEGGCTFTLNNGRCPFLNDSNLCDLFTELGEDKLCETCAEFPRFINEYGNVREIGIAPSCKTAGELMFSHKERLVFFIEENDEPVGTVNDIDGFTFYQLNNARKIVYDILSDRNYTIDERSMLYLTCCKEIQKHLDAERDDLIENVSFKYNSTEKRKIIIEKIRHNQRKRILGLETVKNGNFAVKEEKFSKDRTLENLKSFYSAFKGMEIINKDWIGFVEQTLEFLDGFQSYEDFSGKVHEYMRNNPDTLFEYEQLEMYYAYRYFLDAVYDYNALLKAKNCVVGLLVLRTMEVADWALNGGNISFERRVDLAHLYSRQFEHSYYNFEVYRELFNTKRRYSYNSLMDMLNM
ncbi:MAG: flagellin lysine-N-methylase [Lachnospira sp.]